MTDPICILLFEDDEDHALAIFKHMADTATRNNQYRIVWFDGPFKKPTAGMKGDVPHSVQQPFKIIEVSQRRHSVQAPLDDEEWWQRDFDAAILDILDKKSGEQTGYDFAAWLDRSNHRGKVIIVSGGNASSGILPDLDPTFIRKDADDWICKVIELLPNEKLPEPRVNYQGRPWQSLLSEFFHAAGSKRKWTGAYFGGDLNLSKKLYSFFDVASFDGQLLHELDDMDAMLSGTGQKPNVLFVDVADKHLDEGLVAKTRGAVGINPIVVLFVSNEMAVEESEALSTLNAALVNRERFNRCPSLWADDAVTRLAKCYRRYREVIKRQQPPRPRGKSAKGKQSSPREIQWTEDVIREGLRLFQSTHGLFALGRSIDKVTGGAPSLVSWIKGGDVQLLNQSFTSKLSELVVSLHERSRISADQAKPYVNVQE